MQRSMPVYITSHRTFRTASTVKYTGIPLVTASFRTALAAAHGCSEACSIFIVIIFVVVVIVVVIEILDDA